MAADDDSVVVGYVFVIATIAVSYIWAQVCDEIILSSLIIISDEYRALL